jgi:hypothetical protein
LPGAGGSFPRLHRLKNMPQNTPTSDPLDQKLKSWSVNAPLPPRFQENVWQRVTALDKSPAVSFWRLLEDRLARAFLRPAFASAYLAMFLAIGLGTGFWQARARTAQLDKALATKYVQAVDPFQTPRQ